MLTPNVDPNEDDLSREAADLFGMELGYTPNELVASSQPLQDGEYGGNIVEQRWKTRNPATVDPTANQNLTRAYVYHYDALNRITEARFTTRDHATPSLWHQNAGNYTVSNMTYDLNGNLLSMYRMGAGPNGLYQPQPLDDLKLTYVGNRLRETQDQIATTAPVNDFEDVPSPSGVDYLYDGRGNLTRDENKALLDIRYSYHNLPLRLEWADGKTITNTYTSTGRKVATEVVDEYGVRVRRTEQTSGGFEYETRSAAPPQLQNVALPEGRAMYSGPPTSTLDQPWQWEYHLKDHLGNLRLAFRTRKGIDTGGPDQSGSSFEPSQGRGTTVEPFGRVAETRHFAPGVARTGQYVVRLAAGNGRTSRRLGPVLTRPVHAGDSIYAEVYGYYEPPLPKPWLGGLLGGGSAPELADGTPTARPRTKWLPRLRLNILPFLLATRTASRSGAPLAYLKLSVYNADSQLVEERVVYLSDTIAAGTWQYLATRTQAAQSGYVKVELVDDSPQAAYFDDLLLRLVEPKGIQENHYDPWGQNLLGLESEAERNCMKQFNGKEKTDDFELFWNDHGARNLDFQLGRWWSVDPLAAEFSCESPYVFGRNNPIRFFDPDGCVSIDGQLEITEATTRRRASERDDSDNDDITVYGVGTNGKKAPLAIVKTDLANTSVTTNFKLSGTKPTIIDLTNKSLGKLMPDAFMISLGADVTYGVGLGCSWQIVIINTGIQAGQVFYYGPEHGINDINIGYNLGAGIMAGPVDFNEKCGVEFNKDIFNGLSQGWSGGVGFYSQALITGYADGYRHAPFGFTNAIETYNAKLYGAGVSKAQFGFQYTYSYAYRFEPFGPKK